MQPPCSENVLWLIRRLACLSQSLRCHIWSHQTASPMQHPFSVWIHKTITQQPSVGRASVTPAATQCLVNLIQDFEVSPATFCKQYIGICMHARGWILPCSKGRATYASSPGSVSLSILHFPDNWDRLRGWWSLALNPRKNEKEVASIWWKQRCNTNV